MSEHTLDPAKIHTKWDRSLSPAIEIESGDVVHCQTDEVTGGQITFGGPASQLGELNFDMLYPLAGPIFVKGAQPGDLLEVEILSMTPGSWGWAGIIPMLGLLPDDFKEPYIRHFDLTKGDTTALRDDIQIPIVPFLGTMGVAPDDATEPLQVLPPQKGGGNIDTRHLTAGTKLYLPVFVEGALFSGGDAHAAQGDGEVCVTGIECPMSFSLRFNVKKGRAQGFRYQFLTPPGNLQSRSDAKGYYVATALGPDLFTNAQNAVRDLITWLGDEKGLSPEDAYVLCSLAADLKISQIVDAGVFGVSAYLSLSVFK